MLNLSKHDQLCDQIRSLCSLFESIEGKFGSEFEKAVPLSLQKSVKDSFIKSMKGEWRSIDFEVRISNCKVMANFSECVLLNDAKLISFEFDRTLDKQRVNIISPLAYLCFMVRDIDKVMFLIRDTYANIERACSCIGRPMVRNIASNTEGFESSILLAMLLLDQLDEVKVVTPYRNDYATYEIYKLNKDSHV